MYSIGVDIGTSTLKVVISNLMISRETGLSLLKVTKVEGAEVIYRSPIVFTPLLSNSSIDFTEVRKIVSFAIQESAIPRDKIETGAVIITGETARKENSEETSAALSEFLGDFVVAVAGPKLEGILAGRGAGISDESKKRNKRIINLDIGGGTLNAAVFDSGTVKESFAMDIGGRLIKFDENIVITYISNRIKYIIDEKELPIKLGNKVTFDVMEEFCECLAEACLQACGLKKMTDETKRLYITEVYSPEAIDFVSVSGGVGEFVASEDDLQIYKKAKDYGDIGPILGRKIAAVFEPYREKLIIPKERIRATVIGAGSYALTVSGSTVGFDKEILPVKNIAIIKSTAAPENWSKLAEDTKPLMDMFEEAALAISITGKVSPGYEELKILSEQIAKLYEGNSSPIILLLKEDYAKALYQVIKIHTNCKNPIICLDSINCENGDYIDIGEPLGSAVPVVIKTLIFKS